MELNKINEILKKELEIENNFLINNIEKQKKQIFELKNSNEKLKQENIYIKNEYENLKKEYDAIIYSRSFKIIKRIKSIIKRG